MVRPSEAKQAHPRRVDIHRWVVRDTVETSGAIYGRDPITTDSSRLRVLELAANQSEIETTPMNRQDDVDGLCLMDDSEWFARIRVPLNGQRAALSRTNNSIATLMAILPGSHGS